MSKTSLFLFTFNCGKNRQPVEAIQHAVQKALKPETSASVPPQVLVFGFEEVTSILDASFGLLSDHLAPITLGISAGIKSIYPSTEALYVQAARSQLGAIATIVYVLDSSTLPGAIPLETVSSSTAGTRRGFGYSSLKGAAGVRISLKPKDSSSSTPQEFTFVNAHLAANEGHLETRNADFDGIVTSLGFADGFGAYKPQSHLFFMGDLNYRATRAAEPTERALLEASESAGLDEDGAPLENNRYFEVLKQTDELYHVLQTHKSFYGFEEAPVNFPPTFKYIEGSIGTFNQKRTPSWCDRILYLPYESPAQVINYASLPSVVTSDHKPVYLRINVPSSPPRRVFEPEPGAPKRLLLLPEYAPAVTRAAPQAAAPVRLSLGLGDHAGYYNGVGWTADMVIGWSLYFFNTPRGRIYAGLFLAALFALYLIL